jgi:hypothetical protein
MKFGRDSGKRTHVKQHAFENADYSGDLRAATETDTKWSAIDLSRCTRSWRSASMAERLK